MGRSGQTTMNTRHWGKLPEQLQSECHKKYWGSRSKRLALLRHEITFPIILTLKPPTGTQALAQAEDYQRFIHAWRQFRQPENVLWKTQKMAYFGEQSLPIELHLSNMDALLHFIGEQKIWQRWQNRLSWLQQHLPAHTHKAVLDKLEELDTLPENQLIMLLQVVLQLHENMGKGGYLRALPLMGAHSKFIEQHFVLIEYLTIALHGEAVRQRGLLPWLNCIHTPKDWLFVRPLCAKMRAALANLPFLQLDTQTLLHQPLPSQHVLVIENKAQIAASLPELNDTIVVAGGGYNTAWLSATWLAEKQVAYWGDLDEDGFTILSQARARLPQLPSLMMNTQPLDLFKDFITQDSSQHLLPPGNLTEFEKETWLALHQTQPSQRLEQEYFSADFVAAELNKWISGSLKMQ